MGMSNNKDLEKLQKLSDAVHKANHRMACFILEHPYYFSKDGINLAFEVLGAQKDEKEG
jgi:hypothetical protein